MTTDAERREATDAWAIQLREQQLRDLRAQLATATQRAEAAEARVKKLEAPSVAKLLYAIRDYVPVAELLKDQDRELATLRQRAEAAEAALATAPVGAMKLVIWMLDDGPWDDVALAEVQRWIDAREEAQP